MRDLPFPHAPVRSRGNRPPFSRPTIAAGRLSLLNPPTDSPSGPSSGSRPKRAILPHQSLIRELQRKEAHDAREARPVLVDTADPVL